ncbi:General substrate transporter [Amanita muscaria]
MSRGYNVEISSHPYIVGTFACIGGVLCGFGISTMSGVLDNEAYQEVFAYPGPAAQGAIVASMPAGSIAGALAVTVLADRLGRKKTIILSGIIGMIGSVLQAISANRAMLVVGRIVGGIAIGLGSAVVPIYQSEVTEPSIRGRMIGMQQWSITWGILIQYFIQFGFSYVNGVTSFRVPWALQAIPAIILSLGMTLFPESPRWLLDKGRLVTCFEHQRCLTLAICASNEEALQILADLHGEGNKDNPLVQLEYTEITQQVLYDRTEGAKSYIDLLKSGNPRRVFLGCSLQIWNQLSGMNIMMYYIIYVFQGAGLTGHRANLIADSVQYVLNVVMTVPAIVLIDRWGRRPIILIGTLLMGFFLFIVGGLQATFGEWAMVGNSRAWVIKDNMVATNAIIACSYLFVCSFAASMGPVSWTYPAELYSLKIRGKAVSLATATMWAINTMLAFTVPPSLSSIAWKTYFIFGAFNLAAFLHIFFMFPETVGRSLEEVEDIFDQGHAFAAWKISRNVGQKTLSDVKERSKNPDDEKVRVSVDKI